MSDSRGEQGGEQVRITSEVIPVANEWGVVGNNGERVFLAPSSYGEVILISSPPESNCILTVWQGSTESTPKKLGVKLKLALKTPLFPGPSFRPSRRYVFWVGLNPFACTCGTASVGARPFPTIGSLPCVEAIFTLPAAEPIDVANEAS